MVFKTSYFDVVDNSGVLTTKCLHVYSRWNAILGTLLLVVVRKQFLNLKKHKKKLFWGVVVQI